MRRFSTHRMLAATIALTAMVVSLAPSLSLAQVARFALVVGSNRGTDAAKTLRYAERDAARFAEILTSLGGFKGENVHLLDSPSPHQMRSALETLDHRIREAVPRHSAKALAVVYFSGHADGVHLELGKARFEFAELRRRLESLRADIKILFVDSCQSGGVTRYKGGKPGPSFDLTFSETIDANGTAILTSSAAGEKSQESGQLEGSFFTHFLLSGLRGTADFDQDQKITLSEIYQYTYSKTVAETARTMGGTQHPTYDYRMTGRGKVVLTDLTRGDTQLQFGPEMAGTFLVLKSNTDEIVAEVNKPKGTWRNVSLPSDQYVVATRTGNQVMSDEVTVPSGSRLRIHKSDLSPERSLQTVFDKGAPKQQGIGLNLYYGLLSGALKHYAALHQGIFGLRIDAGPVSLFPRVSVGATNVDEPGLDYRILLISGEAYAAWRFEKSVFDLFVGIGGSAGYGRQTIAGGTLRTGTLFTYGGFGGLEVPFSSGFALSFFWEVGSQVFRAEAKLAQHVLLRGSIGVGYVF